MMLTILCSEQQILCFAVSTQVPGNMLAFDIFLNFSLAKNAKKAVKLLHFEQMTKIPFLMLLTGQHFLPTGGAISLLALNGLFILVHRYNL